MKYNIEKLDAILSDPNKSFADRVREFKAELEYQQIKSNIETNNACPECASTSRQQCNYTPKVCLDCCQCTEHNTVMSYKSVIKAKQ
jgi:hypothetical protein